MAAPVLSQSYTITSYDLGQITLDGVGLVDWPVDGGFITSSLNSDKHYVWNANSNLNITPFFSSDPTDNVDSVQYLGEPEENQILWYQESVGNQPAFIATYGTSSVEITSLNVGDEVTFNSETATIVGLNNSIVPSHLSDKAAGIELSSGFTNLSSLLTKFVGTDIIVSSPAGAPVSGSSYTIAYYDNSTTRTIFTGIDPTLWPTSGAYIEYDGQTYWAIKDVIDKLYGFSPSLLPTVGTDTITFVSASTTFGQVLMYDDTPIVYGGHLILVGTPIENLNVDLAGYQLIFNGETRYVVGTPNIGLGTNYEEIYIDSPFTTSPIGEIYGTGLITGSAPVNGQIIDGIVGAVSIGMIGVPTFSVGAQLTYLGETRTVIALDDLGTWYLSLDSGFTNSLVGKVLGVDITITPGNGVPPKPTKPAVAKVEKPAEVAAVTRPQAVAQVVKPEGVAKITKG